MVQRNTRTSVRSNRIRRRLYHLSAAICVLLLAGCSWFSRHEPASAGLPYALTPAFNVHPAMMNAAGTYQNACGAAETIATGRPLAAAVQRKLGGVFQRMIPGSGPQADGVIEIALVSQRINLAIPRPGEGAYPASVTIGLDVAYQANDGTTIFSKTLERSKAGKVTVQGASCEVSGLDAIVNEAAELVAEAVITPLAQSPEVREWAAAKRSGGASAADSSAVSPSVTASLGADPAHQARPEAGSSPAQAASASPGSSPASGATDLPPGSLTFRAIMRDESRDQILQPEEPLTIEIEVKNDGLSEIRGVEVLVSGTGTLTAQLPSSIAVGTVQPGELRRTTITKPVAGIMEPLRGEILLTLRAGSPLAQAPPAKKFVVLVKPASVAGAPAPLDVDQPPKPVAAFKQPKAVVLAIGVGHFRDERVAPVKYAGRDAEVMAAYLQSMTGVANDRVRILRDGQALKQDLAEAFEEWLPKQVDADTVVYVFFSGRGLVDGATGAVSLVPFDGTSATAGRLFTLRRIQDSLAKVSLHRAILMFDVSLEPAPGADPKASASPVWGAGESESSTRIMWMIGNRSLQEAHAYEPARHGLFTFHLLKGLQGLADLDRDGTVVAGELCAYGRGEVGRAAREQFGNGQEPLCLPPPGQGAMVRMQPMARGNNPKPAPSATKDSLGSGGGANAPAAGVGAGP